MRPGSFSTMGTAFPRVPPRNDPWRVAMTHGDFPLVDINLYSVTGNFIVEEQRQRRTGPPGSLAFARWTGWSAGQLHRQVTDLLTPLPRKTKLTGFASISRLTSGISRVEMSIQGGPKSEPLYQLIIELTPGFRRSVSVAVAVSVKTVSVPLVHAVAGACARQAQEAGRRVSRAKEWAELQACTNGRYGKIELDPI